MSEEFRQLGFDTKAVKLGYKPDVSNNYSLVPTIGLSSTYQQDDPSSHRVSAHCYTGNRTLSVTTAVTLKLTFAELASEHLRTGSYMTYIPM